MNYDAMIIIDMQTALINEHPFNERKVISNIQELISLCRMQNIPLIYIRHDGGTGDELEKGLKVGKYIKPLLLVKRIVLLIKNITVLLDKQFYVNI